MDPKNPYLKKPVTTSQPILSRVPIHDFPDPYTMERDMLPFELVVARIPNTKPTGFTHHVALVYKDDMDRVYSLQLLQHHGELKETPENKEFLQKIEGEKQHDTPKKPGNKGKKSSPRQRTHKSKKRI